MKPWLSSSGPHNTALTVLVIGLLATTVTTLYCIQSYPQEDLEVRCIPLWHSVCLDMYLLGWCQDQI